MNDDIDNPTQLQYCDREQLVPKVSGCAVTEFSTPNHLDELSVS